MLYTHVDRITIGGGGKTEGVAVFVVESPALTGCTCHDKLAPCVVSVGNTLLIGEDIGGVTNPGALCTVLDVIVTVFARSNLPDEVVQQFGILGSSSRVVSVLGDFITEPEGFAEPAVATTVGVHTVIRSSTIECSGTAEVFTGSEFIECYGIFAESLAIGIVMVT